VHHPPDTEQVPEVVGQWKMLAAELVNSAADVALLPANKLFIFGGYTPDPDEYSLPLILNHEGIPSNGKALKVG